MAIVAQERITTAVRTVHRRPAGSGKRVRRAAKTDDQIMSCRE